MSCTSNQDELKYFTETYDLQKRIGAGAHSVVYQISDKQNPNPEILKCAKVMQVFDEELEIIVPKSFPFR